MMNISFFQNIFQRLYDFVIQTYAPQTEKIFIMDSKIVLQSQTAKTIQLQIEYQE